MSLVVMTTTPPCSVRVVERSATAPRGVTIDAVMSELLAASTVAVRAGRRGVHRLQIATQLYPFRSSRARGRGILAR
jgi:hypothetical protein